MERWRPKLVLSAATAEEIRRLLTPCIGRRNTRRVRAEVRDLIAAAHPGHRIEVVDKTDIARRLFDGITLGVVVDGVPDQGIVVMARKADATC